jgi:signal transduction histidine kinase
MRRGHWIAIDCVVGAFIAFIDTAAFGKSFHWAARWPLVLLFLIAVFIPLALRRRAPTTAFGALLILGVLLARLRPTVPATVFLAAAYVLFTVTVEGRRRTGAAALGLVLAVMVFLIVVDPSGQSRSDAVGDFIPVALANVIAWMTGYSMRQRRLYVVTLQHQAASSAVAEERLRIARELHDVVAHSMSVIAVQAGYGQYVIDASPGGARDALGAIQATSRDALEEMRRMLGVLRQQDVTPGPATAGPAAGTGQAGTGPAGPPAGPAPAARQAPLGPAPGLASLDRLITRTRGAGVRVTLEVSGPPRPAPAGVDLSAFRIIQEALTNVVKHAGTSASCLVSVGYTDSDLVIRVTDDGGLPVTLPVVSVPAFLGTGTGHGVIGMRERVHLCGGTFTAGPRPGGGFQVMATLPLPATSFEPRRGPGPRAGGAEGPAAADRTAPAAAPRPDGVPRPAGTDAGGPSTGPSPLAAPSPRTADSSLAADGSPATPSSRSAAGAVTLTSAGWRGRRNGGSASPGLASGDGDGRG